MSLSQLALTRSSWTGSRAAVHVHVMMERLVVVLFTLTQAMLLMSRVLSFLGSAATVAKVAVAERRDLTPLGRTPSTAKS